MGSLLVDGRIGLSEFIKVRKLTGQVLVKNTKTEVFRTHQGCHQPQKSCHWSRWCNQPPLSIHLSPPPCKPWPNWVQPNTRLGMKNTLEFQDKDLSSCVTERDRRGVRNGEEDVPYIVGVKGNWSQKIFGLEEWSCKGTQSIPLQG